MTKYSTAVGKGLYAELDGLELLDYGSVISGELVQTILNIEIPVTANKEVFTSLALYELSAVDYVRNVLLGHGKYLAQANGDYRVFLPSENAKQCERYISSANKKLSRSLKLSRNTHLVPNGELNNLSARVLITKAAIRKPH